MMDWHATTIKTYDDSSKELAEYFSGIGARTKDIELGLKLASVNGNARVIEIGCGDGRDAVEIVKRVGWYEGFDPSKGLLELAGTRLPDTSFVIADALSYSYPTDIDVMYAFASLLHVNRTDLRTVLEKSAVALRKGGILFVSLKERPLYEEVSKTDQFGQRMFYYYNPQILTGIAGDLFEAVYEDHQTIGSTDWFTLALKKI